MKLAIFVDQMFRWDGDHLSTDESYIQFPASFASAFEKVVFIGRCAPSPGRGPYSLSGPSFELCALPDYDNIYGLWRRGPAFYAELRRRIANAMHDWDALLVSGPHPLGQLIARQCAAAGIPVALIVRQNLGEQMRAHAPPLRYVAMAAAAALEWDFRRLARGKCVFTVGMEMADAYSRYSTRVHNHFPCLVTAEQLKMFSTFSPGGDVRRLLNVARLSPEKAQHLLIDALDLLRSRGITCHLDFAGSGPCEAALKAQSKRLGLEAQVTFHGHVPFGSELFALYRQAGAFVLSSFTEGFPQAINESLSIGLPTIATRVGGIPSFLTDGQTALLVPPNDVPALAGAIERLVGDPDLGDKLRRNGQALMADNTLEANRDRVLKVIFDDVITARR